LQSHQRLPPAVLHHPLHLGHLAAAAASGFGATSADFLGKLLFFSNLLQRSCESFSWQETPQSLMKLFYLGLHMVDFTKSSGASNVRRFGKDVEGSGCGRT
jgi:hypothetical protein